MVGEDRRTVRRAHTGDVGEVLDRYRQTAEHPALGGRPGEHPIGVVPSTVEAQGRKRVHRTVDGCDPAFQRVQQIMGCQLAATEAFDHRRGIGSDEVHDRES